MLLSSVINGHVWLCPRSLCREGKCGDFPKDLLQETETGDGGEVEERQEEMVFREKKNEE